MTDRIAKFIGEGLWNAAFEVFDELLNGDFFPYPTYFRNITGLSDYFNELSVALLSCLFFFSNLSLYSRRIRPTRIRRGFSSE
jgi:hypothetical protein